MSHNNNKKKKRKYLLRRKRTLDQGIIIDYKNPDILKRFVTDRGKIIPRRISGASQEQQRKITLAVKRARYLSLLPYDVCHETERGFSGEMQAAAQAMTNLRGTGSKGHSPRSRDEGGRDFSDRSERSDRPERSDRNDQNDN